MRALGVAPLVGGRLDLAVVVLDGKEARLRSAWSGWGSDAVARLREGGVDKVVVVGRRRVPEEVGIARIETVAKGAGAEVLFLETDQVFAALGVPRRGDLEDLSAEVERRLGLPAGAMKPLGLALAAGAALVVVEGTR